MNLKEHYKKLFEEHGDTHLSAQWSSKETQEKRFQILTEIADIDRSEVLDYGCGTGHLGSYLKERGLSVELTGVDIVPEMIECAKLKHPEHHFFLESQLSNEKFDYVFISGVFNNKMDDNYDFYTKTLKKLANHARKGIAFNMLSSYVDFYNEDLFYENPETVFSFVKKEISPFITIRNDYQLKENIIPFEFTVYVYFN